ncbi:hypothetical protein DH2020_018245 [Rehmannia glutinosa]|uniref:thioredoxin-dependent peroxiredoxin n=1 Tax=Rehmannia glutinosa TaxID=99300 RepID=A0ABR0WKB7_REHGL
MACSAATSMAALISSNPNPKAYISSRNSVSSKSISLTSSFSGRPFVSRVPRSLSSSSSSKRRSLVVRASEVPLVGNTAPDFEAEAVFDQEFIKFSHLAWVQTDRKSGGLGDLRYPLVSDVTKSVSKSYGVLIPDQGIALRGLFIIDKEGVIQHSTINNLAIGRSVDETLRTLQVLFQFISSNLSKVVRHSVLTYMCMVLVQALQYVQDNPDEVCPAGWKPGEKSMKPDPKLSKEYFAAI